MKKLRIAILIVLLALTGGLVVNPTPTVLAELNRQQTLPAALPMVTGSIGGYTEQVGDVALAVEANGRIHALWTGVLNPAFDTFVFYATSTDGINWTPYQTLNYWYGYDPQIAVDDTNHRVHLMYRSNIEGIIHHTVTNGVVSAPTVVDTGLVTSPKLAVDPTTGFVYALWMETYEQPLDDGYTSAYRRRTWYAYWDGARWSARLKKINDNDTCHSSVATAPGGGVLLAWFQRCSQTAGGPVDPGEATVVRSAFGNSDPTQFPLRQAASAFYTVPEKDSSILLIYSAGDDKFYLVTTHLMWPGHSRVYRYTWQAETWSAPVNVSKNTSNWAIPIYAGAAAGAAQVIYVYTNNDEILLRTETGGVLSEPQSLTNILTGLGYSGLPYAYFADRAGNLHLALAGEMDGVAGFYYIVP